MQNLNGVDADFIETNAKTQQKESYAKLKLVTREVKVETTTNGTGNNFSHPFFFDF